MFVAIGSVCAADINSDVNSDKNLNSEEIIANSNGIDNSNNVIDSQGSQISVDNAKETDNSNVDSVSASNVKESSQTKNVNINVEPSNDVKANTAITKVGATSSTVTIAQVIAAASSVKTYVEKNHALPSSVTVGSVSVSSAKFAYLESMAVQYLNSGKSTSTKITVLSVSGSSATYTINKNPTKASYVSAAKSVSSACSSKKAVPAYVTVSSAKADSRVYTYAFAKILVFYKNNNNRLPNTCTFDSSVFKSTPTPVPSSFTISQIITAAGNLKTYVEKNKALPNTVTVGSSTLSIAQFASLEPVAIQRLNEGKSVSTKISLVNASKPSITKYSINNNPTKASYISVAKSVSNYINTNKIAPAYATVESAKADFRVYTYAFAKILVFYKNNNKLPNTCTFQSSVFDSSNPDITYKKGVNEIATEKDLSAYLKYYTRDKANDAIKALAKKLTANCKTNLEKANAIYNYVRDHVSYSYYYNSVYYATGTYSRKAANCCDHSNLIVSLCKSAGLAARYSHATCTFSSGLRVGHVWAQIYVDGVWYAADATSSRNSLGHVNNWKLSSMSGLNQYAALPF